MARKWPALLQLDQLVDREVDLRLRHVALVAVLDQAGAFKAERGIHDADRGHVEDRRLALDISGLIRLLPLGDLVTDEIGAVADRVGVVDLRQERRPFGDAVVQFGRVGFAIYIAS